MIKNTGIVKAGFNRYLMDGFKRGIPPTEAIEMKKNTMDIKIRQKPMEYKSLVLKFKTGLSGVLFKRNLGTTTAPMKKAMKAMAIETTRLKVSLFRDNNKKIAKTKITIKGEKIYLLSILFLLMKPRKFLEG